MQQSALLSLKKKVCGRSPSSSCRRLSLNLLTRLVVAGTHTPFFSSNAMNHHHHPPPPLVFFFFLFLFHVLIGPDDTRVHQSRLCLGKTFFKKIKRKTSYPRWYIPPPNTSDQFHDGLQTYIITIYIVFLTHRTGNSIYLHFLVF